MLNAWLVLIFSMAVATGQSLAQVKGEAFCTPTDQTENIVIFLTGSQVPEPTPPRTPPIMDQRNLEFIPHVLPIVRGTTVAFPNSDSVRHNVFSPSDTKMFNLGTYPPGVLRTVTFDRAGVVQLLCNVHPEMSAFIVVLSTPYYARTDRRGLFQINKIPPGDYTLNFWCEHRGTFSRELKLKAGETARIHAVLHDEVFTMNGRALPPATSAQVQEP